MLDEIWWHYSEIPQDPDEESQFMSWADQANFHLQRMREALTKSFLPEIWGKWSPPEPNHTRSGRIKMPAISGDTAVENPTSFDNWYNEYNVPLRNSQIETTRRPYRR